MAFSEDFEARRAAMVTQGHWRNKTLLDYLSEHVKSSPDKIALLAHRAESDTKFSFTYRDIDTLSDHLAISLMRLGIGSGDVVSFQLPNWYQFNLLHLAALKIGAITNPLMVIFRERELKFMLGLAESRILIVPARFRQFDYAALAHAVQADLPSLQHIFVVDGTGSEDFETLLNITPTAEELEKLRAHHLSPDAVIQLLYTSGTTGEPKGVMHSSNTMLSNLAPFAERLSLGREDTIHMPSPMAHQLGFMYGLVLPVLLGAPVVLQDIFRAEDMARQIVQHGATFTMGATPFLSDLSDFVETTHEGTPTLRIFVSAGAPIPRALVAKAQKVLGAAIVSGWGMSENGAVTITRPHDPDEKVISTDGVALPGMEVRVLDLQGGVAGTGVDGPLQVRGCSNFLGYFKRPNLANISPEGWFDTGDIARMDADGYIRIAGRTKDIVIRGGENIPVVEIEGLLYKHPAVQTVAIVGYPDSRLGERACAFVTLRDGMTLSFEEMVTFLKEQKVTTQYIPERLEILNALPATPSGKIQKFRLREAVKQLEF